MDPSPGSHGERLGGPGPWVTSREPVTTKLRACSGFTKGPQRPSASPGPARHPQDGWRSRLWARTASQTPLVVDDLGSFQEDRSGVSRTVPQSGLIRSVPRVSGCGNVTWDSCPVFSVSGLDWGDGFWGLDRRDEGHVPSHRSEGPCCHHAWSLRCRPRSPASSHACQASSCEVTRLPPMWAV